MSRVQLALNVSNIDEAVAFYSKLFNTEVNKRKPSISSVAIRVASVRCLARSLFSRNVACTPTSDSMPKAITASATSASIRDTPSRRKRMICMVRKRCSAASSCQALGQTSRNTGRCTAARCAGN